MSSTEDFEKDYSSFDAGQVLAHLDRRIQEVLRNVEASKVWQTVLDPRTDRALMIDIIKEIYLEIVMYQTDSVNGSLAAIMQFPRTMPSVWFQEMLNHQAEEFDHGEMALRDYIALGGNEAEARGRRMSPSAFAVSAIWNNIGAQRDPFVYLGAIYLFEALTPIVTERVQARLRERLGAETGLEFVVHHATADLEHAREIRQLIGDVVGMFPDKSEAVLYGFEYFAYVYPLPVWSAAMSRAERRHRRPLLAAE